MQYSNFDENVFIKVTFLCKKREKKDAHIAVIWT